MLNNITCRSIFYTKNSILHLYECRTQQSKLFVLLIYHILVVPLLYLQLSLQHFQLICLYLNHMNNTILEQSYLHFLGLAAFIYVLYAAS